MAFATPPPPVGGVSEELCACHQAVLTRQLPSFCSRPENGHSVASDGNLLIWTRGLACVFLIRRRLHPSPHHMQQALAEELKCPVCLEQGSI